MNCSIYYYKNLFKKKSRKTGLKLLTCNFTYLDKFIIKLKIQNHIKNLNTNMAYILIT